MLSFIVEEIEFDFDSEFISKDERIQLTQDTLGVWHVTEENQLIDFISDSIGWCVKSIKYCKNRPHALTSYM